VLLYLYRFSVVLVLYHYLTIKGNLFLDGFPRATGWCHPHPDKFFNNF
jgi:hypothetical protein